MTEAPFVSILTPTIPGREDFLVECELSVVYQTHTNHEHRVALDEGGEGCAVLMNRLAYDARGDWLMPLADDDLLLPRGLAHLLDHAGKGDIIYSPPLVTGNEDRWWFFQAPPVIPAVALIRTTLWRELGGYDETTTREEDRGFWIAALAAGAKFVRVDEPCWVYRQHAGNKSFAVAA
jgi:hypothetical protein